MELRASKQKVKLKGQVASQQDNLLSERQAAIEKAQGENHTLRNELANLKADQESSKKKVMFAFQDYAVTKIDLLCLLKCSDAMLNVSGYWEKDVMFWVIVQTEEVTTKLEEAQNMLQSNQQMIQ